MVNQALKKIHALLKGVYAADIKGGCPIIAPEKLLRAMLLQIFYSIRMEQTQYNLLDRWFIGLAVDHAVWVTTVLTKNRERLIEHDAVVELFSEVLAIANQNNWLSSDHFSVDGTLIQAWAGHKSFVRKDGNDKDDDAADSTNLKGASRSNETNESSTAADARLYCKGDNASRLRFMGHTLANNRHGLIANAMVATANGHAERAAAKVMIPNAKQVADDVAQVTQGANKGYDAAELIKAVTDMNVVPHVAQNTSGRKSAVPGSIAKTEGYAISQQKRKLFEQGSGWAKFICPTRQLMVRGLKRVDQLFVLTMAANNLTRMRALGQVRPVCAVGG